jgi:hypothetical protein
MNWHHLVSFSRSRYDEDSEQLCNSSSTNWQKHESEFNQVSNGYLIAEDQISEACSFELCFVEFYPGGGCL